MATVATCDPLGRAARRAWAEGSLTMQRWEYLFFEIGTDDHGKPFIQASIERYQREDPQGDIADIVNELGDEGWEMVNCGTGTSERRFFPYLHLEAVFKRPKAED